LPAVELVDRLGVEPLHRSAVDLLEGGGGHLEPETDVGLLRGVLGRSCSCC
jgi:hypothetical protein